MFHDIMLAYIIMQNMIIENEFDAHESIVDYDVCSIS